MNGPLPLLGQFSQRRDGGSVPCVDGTPLARVFWLGSQSWSVAPMCPAFLLGANTDGLHAIRKVNSLSLARARRRHGTDGFC
jgi:hypothetical protein